MINYLIEEATTIAIGIGLGLVLAVIFLIYYKIKAGKAQKLHNSAAKRMQKYGEEDGETLKLYNQAIVEYKKCIEKNKNLGESYNYLGRILFTGPKSIRNYGEALQYLQKAVEIYEKERKDGDFIPHCYNELGTVLYRLGDYNSSFANYKKSAIYSPQFAGDEAFMYWLGLGAELDLPKAMDAYKRASIAGRELWYNIYILSYQINEYKKGNYKSEALTLFFNYLHSKTMGEDKESWMSILKQSADLGLPPAQVDFWLVCRDDKEFNKGMPYLEKVLTTDFAPAFFHMGYVYHLGLNNTEKDYNEAKKWYEKAAVEGFPLAQSNLGVLYYNNLIAAEGLSNREMAYYWWDISAKQGYSPAVSNRALVGRYGVSQSNFGKAIQMKNNVVDIIKTSTEIYNSLNKSNIQSYIPPGNKPTLK
jgi:TPR repeat protein